jgi:hypothetical protein
MKVSDEFFRKWLKKILNNPEKAQIFVREPIEGFNLVPGFYFYGDSF